MTSSLFATTVLASFFVVALPHILPCPAPRRAYADGEMPDPTARRRPRKPEGAAAIAENGIVEFRPGQGEDNSAPARSKPLPRRECPVPKPGGVLGEWLGFNKPTEENGPSRRPDR